MLLDHTSGLADYFLNPKIDRPLQADPPTALDRPTGPSRYVGKPTVAAGRGWHYSNTNYLLLGLIAERITGQPLAAAIRTRLLDPVGLAATWYQAGEAARARARPWLSLRRHEDDREADRPRRRERRRAVPVGRHGGRRSRARSPGPAPISPAGRAPSTAARSSAPMARHCC